jgi:hypothetical protein
VLHCLASKNAQHSRLFVNFSAENWWNKYALLGIFVDGNWSQSRNVMRNSPRAGRCNRDKDQSREVCPKRAWRQVRGMLPPWFEVRIKPILVIR